MLDSALGLCRYHRYANDKLLRHLEALPGDVMHAPVAGPFSSIAETLEHMAAVDWLWLDRLRADTNNRDVLPEWHTLQDALPVFEGTARAFEALVAMSEDLSRVISYKNSTGEPFQNSVLEIVQHVVNHGTYHRGNITVMLRQLGHAGVSTDYIFFVRE